MSAAVLLIISLGPVVHALSWRRPKPARVVYPRTPRRGVKRVS